MNIGRRIHLEGPDWRPAVVGVPWWKCSGGHGGDEYGNCSVYFRCFLFGIVFFWDPHYQDKVELPLNQADDELQQWRRWYSEKFEGGEDLWA
jgi:hypothetical protein